MDSLEVRRMVFQIVAPKLGMSMSDVTIVEWKVKEGEKVEKGTCRTGH